MRPVFQSKLYAADAPMRGNCQNACWASLLEVPLWMVPAFEDMRGDLQEERRNEWIQRFFGLDVVRTHGHDLALLPEFYIACGPSPRGQADRIYHSVIYSRGALAHDPHPIGDGILLVEWTWHLVPVERTR